MNTKPREVQMRKAKDINKPISLLKDNKTGNLKIALDKPKVKQGGNKKYRRQTYLKKTLKYKRNIKGIKTKKNTKRRT
jgi:hypothetical protein